MEEHRRAVARHMKVELDGIGAGVDRQFHRDQRVFRCLCAVAPMRHDLDGSVERERVRALHASLEPVGWTCMVLSRSRWGRVMVSTAAGGRNIYETRRPVSVPTPRGWELSNTVEQ